MPLTTVDLSIQRERTEALWTVRKEMATIVAAQRISLYHLPSFVLKYATRPLRLHNLHWRLPEVLSSAGLDVLSYRSPSGTSLFFLSPTLNCVADETQPCCCAWTNYLGGNIVRHQPAFEPGPLLVDGVRAATVDPRVRMDGFQLDVH